MEIRTYYWNDRVVPEWKIKLKKMLGGNWHKLLSTGNCGDLLNKDILEKRYGANVVNVKDEGNRLLFIGSVSHRVQDGDVLCGIGTQGKADNVPLRKNVSIYGLRGPVSYDEFKRKGYDLSEVKFLLDPGLLVRFMYGSDVEPVKGKVVFIPHYKERKHYRGISDSVELIDIDATAEDVCKSILSAEHVYSSSLHGVVFAHALNRPVTLVEPLFESMLKFEDYYSSVSLNLPSPLKGFDGKSFLGTDVSPADIKYSEEDFFLPGLEELREKSVVV